MAQIPIRKTIAVLAVLVASAAAALLGGTAWAALATLAGGGAAILMLIAPQRSASVEPAGSQRVPPPDFGQIATTIGEALSDPLLLTQDDRIIAANDAADALLGRGIVGEDVRLAIRHPAAAERLASPEAGGPIDLVGLKGEQSWELHLSPVTRGYRAIHLIDRTARYAADRMRVDFVANASHELKTPLASLLGYIETLSDAAAGSDAALRDRFFGIMAGEALRMQRLVEDLISLSRIEAEKYRPPAERIDLGALIESIVAQIAAGDDPRARDLTLAPGPAVPAVNGDRTQLSQLLHNLIANAMKYGEPGTPVTISLAVAGTGMARLVIADRGEGIAREHIPRLTERFYRVDAGRSRAVGGTGLGLAIVKHIVERHRGQLEIDSIVGTGTTVTVLLPLFPDEAVSSKSHLSVARGS
jgi:two-component system phosphate regulon sensor histidine kinase PhoR